MGLETENLGKQYDGETWGIRDVSLEFDDGIY